MLHQNTSIIKFTKIDFGISILAPRLVRQSFSVGGSLQRLHWVRPKWSGVLALSLVEGFTLSETEVK